MKKTKHAGISFFALLLALKLAYDYVKMPGSLDEARKKAITLEARYEIFEGRAQIDGQRTRQVRVNAPDGSLLRLGCSQGACQALPHTAVVNITYFESSLLVPAEFLLEVEIDGRSVVTAQEKNIAAMKLQTGLAALVSLLVFLWHRYVFIRKVS